MTELLLEKKGRAVRLLDVGALTSYTDYLILVTATSDRHARALGSYCVESMKKKPVCLLGIEGMDTGQWVLVDYGSVIVHVFQADTRDYYDLDGLWADAKGLTVEQEPRDPGTRVKGSK